MKLPFGSNAKRKPSAHRHLTVHDPSIGCPADTSAGMYSDCAVRTPTIRDKMLEREKMMEEEFNSRKNLGDWVKTLNCTSSKKDSKYDYDFIAYPAYPAASVRNTRELNWKAKKEEDITRPVVITVKDGDGAQQSHTLNPGRNDFKTSISVGDISKTPSRFGLFKRNSKKSLFEEQKHSPRSVSKEMDDFMTAQEIARRNRWREGIKRSWRDDGDLPSTIHRYDDESSYTGCSSSFTGDSFATGFTNATRFSRATDTTCGSVETDYTTDYTEDFSDGSDIYRNPSKHRRSHDRYDRYYYGRSESRGTRRSRRSRRYSPERRRHRRRDSSPESTILSGVAEDLGILAGLIISDGSACVGGMANATKATLTSCRVNA